MAAVALLLGSSTSAYTLARMPGVVSRPIRATDAFMQVNDYSSRSTDPENVVKFEPSWKDPREGEPFGNADRDEKTGYRKSVGGVRVGEEAFQPRGISDASVIDSYQTYIETMDEPWHATCRPTTTITKGALIEGEKNMIPFLSAEAALDAAVRAAKDAATVEKAIAAGLKAGARPGSPSMAGAEKVKGLFEKEDEKAAEKAKPKAPKAPGKQGAGWDNFERGVAKVHDNSV